jgi:hypothetical protein
MILSLATVAGIAASFGLASPEDPTLPDDPIEPYESFSVIIHIYSYANASASIFSGDFYGHSFFTVQNVSGSTLTIGQMSVTQSTTITLGTWGNKSQHSGVWYNLESVYYNGGYYDGVVSLSYCLTAEQLTTFNDYVVGHDSWTLFNNCATFAHDCWNTACWPSLSGSGLITPGGLCNAISAWTWYQTNNPIPLNSNTGYFQDGAFQPVSI